MPLYTEETGGQLIIPPPSHIAESGWPKRQFVSRRTSGDRPGQSCWEGLADYVDALKVKLSSIQRRFEHLRDHPNQSEQSREGQAKLLKERTHLSMCLDHYELVLSKQTKRLNELALKQSAKAARMAQENREYIAENRRAIKKFDRCRGHIKTNRDAISRNTLAMKSFIENAHRQSAIIRQAEQNTEAIIEYAKTLQGVQRSVSELQQLLNARPAQKVHPPPSRKAPWSTAGYNLPALPALADTFILDRD